MRPPMIRDAGSANRARGRASGGLRFGPGRLSPSEVLVMTARIGTVAGVVVAAALIYLTLAAAQPQPQGQRAPPTLDERVGVLERGFASLSTRFELRDSAAPPIAGGALEPRIAELERALDRLAVDLQRVERQADNALREASDARREAMNAERAARDAAMRVR
jgi:hypothetical protein